MFKTIQRKLEAITWDRIGMIQRESLLAFLASNKVNLESTPVKSRGRRILAAGK